MPTLTSRAAQGIQDRITTTGGWCIWIVRRGPVSGYVAWAMVADNSGGRQEGGELAAATLDELRARLPAGLTRREPSPMLGRDVIETVSVRW